MTKKILIVAGGVTLAGLLVFGTGLLSYVKTSANVVSDAVKDSVPMDFELKRARQLLADSQPEIARAMHEIAREEQGVKQLANQIAQAEGELATDKSQIMRLKADLGTNQEIYEYGGRTFTVQQVRTDLTNRFARYKVNDNTLTSLREIYTAREASLDAARRKLTEMIAARQQLEVEVANLEARLKSVEVAQAASELKLDNSRIGRVKELVNDLKARMEVTEALVQSEGYNPGEIPLDQPSAANIEEEVTTYFTERPAEGNVANK